MATPQSGKWRGLMVCADRTIKVTLTLNFVKDGTLNGDYSFRDKKYSEEARAGGVEGTHADNLVVITLAGAEGYYNGSFQGEIHPALPNKHQVMSGFVHVHRRRKVEAGVLVVFSELATGQSLSGWNGT